MLVKNEKSKGLLCFLNNSFRQYELPNTMELLGAAYTKARWKNGRTCLNSL